MGGSGREPGALLSDANPDFGIILTGSASSIPITLSNMLSVPILATGIFEEDAFYTDLQGSLIPANGELVFNIYCDPLHNIDYEDFLRVELSDGLDPLIAHVTAEAHYPDSYYDGTQNLWCEDLKLALRDIIDNHTSLGYTAARDHMYGHIDNDDTCSECPTLGCVECVYTGRIACFNTRTGANENSFNCEHTWPQSFFCENEPMRSDIFHLYPTDVTANSIRDNYDFGIVVTPTWSVGGSKRGTDSEGQVVFEPRDSHKGNVARTHFYYTTRYTPAQIEACDSYEDPEKLEEILRIWHLSDPVDSRELQRNEDIYDLQHNRNPYIDHPELVDRICAFWGSGTMALNPEIAVAPSAIDMGTIALDTETQFSFAVINTGNNALVVTAMTSTNSDFGLDTTELNLAPESYDIVSITYTSGGVATTDYSTLQITNNDSDEGYLEIPVVIHVSGSSGVEDGEFSPVLFHLHQNHPNPFAAQTFIKYDLPAISQVRLGIYNIRGQKVATLTDERQGPGSRTVRWNATDDYGHPVTSGIYFINLEAGDFTSTNKMLLIR